MVGVGRGLGGGKGWGVKLTLEGRKVELAPFLYSVLGHAKV